jgi:hypothetical protein
MLRSGAEDGKDGKGGNGGRDGECHEAVRRGTIIPHSTVGVGVGPGDLAVGGYGPHRSKRWPRRVRNSFVTRLGTERSTAASWQSAANHGWRLPHTHRKRGTDGLSVPRSQHGVKESWSR